jgi:hypothetical protein
MSKRYALRITEKNHPLVTVLSSLSTQATVVQGEETYFLFTIDSPSTTTDHDVVHEDDLYNYDGHLEEERVILL